MNEEIANKTANPTPSTPAEEIPSEADLEQNPLAGASLEEAQRYGRSQLACDLADKAIDLIYLGTMALLVARPLDTWLAGYVDGRLGRMALLYLITMLLHEVISLPLSFYSGHILEHRYGLSRQTAAGWFKRHFKAYGLALVFGLVLFGGLFLLIGWSGRYWWLVAAAAFFLVSVVMGQLAPVLILPLFYKLERLADETLLDRMRRLADGTGLAIEGVYRMELSEETVKANAMLAGLGRTRRVLIGDTLLENFTTDEIEVIFAHEVGHHVFAHLRKMLLRGVLYSLAGFWISDWVLTSWLAAEQGSSFSYATLPAYALPMIMFVLAVFSAVLEPLQNTISRRYERQCDRYALDRTANPVAYRSAFHKLSRLNKDDPNPPRLEVVLFHSHPPISERLAVADA